MEKYEIRLAELSQCCLGTNSDVSGLRASISATLHSHAVEAAKVEEQRDERKRKQMRFDLDRVVAAVKVQGGPSGHRTQLIYIKLKVPPQHKLLILKCNSYFNVNMSLTRWTTL